MRRPTAHATRRGFTLLEVMVAGLITAIILGSVATSLAELGRVKQTSRARLAAHLRADSALRTLRRDIASVMRRDDLFLTRLRLEDRDVLSPIGRLDRDELLLFDTRFRAIREIDYRGEGNEYEAQFRIEDDAEGPVLWHRRDPVPDDVPGGGGMLIPVVEGLVGLGIEAYDGETWHPEWDSDILGLPTALRLTVTASGHRGADDVFDAPRVVLRTVVPIDRVVPPDAWADAELELIEEEIAAAEEEAMGGAAGAARAGGAAGAEAAGEGGLAGGPGGAEPGLAPSPAGPMTITDPDGNVHIIPGTGGRPGDDLEGDKP